MLNPSLPKIAIIMPAFNAGQYIANSIQSVLAQSEDCWELWIIDDGSTDDTASIVQDFQDQRIHYHSAPHLGKPGSVRNLGVHLSQSTYLAFLDSDDQYHPDFLKTFSQLLDCESKTKMVYGFLTAINSNGEPVSSAGFKLLPDPVSSSQHQLPLSYQHSWKRIALAQFSASTAFMIRRDFFEALGMFSEKLKASEDLHFFYKAFLAEREAVKAFPLYAVSYRKNMNSLTRTKENLKRLLASQLFATASFFKHSSCPEAAHHYEREAYMRRYSYICGVCLEHGHRLEALYFCVMALFSQKRSLTGWFKHCSSIAIRAILFPHTLDRYIKQFAVYFRDGLHWQSLIPSLKGQNTHQRLRGNISASNLSP